MYKIIRLTNFINKKAVKSRVNEGDKGNDIMILDDIEPMRNDEKKG